MVVSFYEVQLQLEPFAQQLHDQLVMIERILIIIFLRVRWFRIC
jgi:hypothetical protein